MSALLEADPLLVWGLFTRGVGLVFLISFFSLGIQIAEFAGADSAIPMSARFERLAKDFPTWRRFLYFPTLLWLNASTATLRALTILGFFAAAAVVYGGPWSQGALLVCYVCYLSLDLTMGLIFPWDSFLFECVVLGLFLPVTHSLPMLGSVEAPAPALTWAYRVLLFRLMFGFGKQKFVGSRPEDLAYLKGFLVSQPLPSALGWYMQKLPSWLLKGGVLFMFLVEIPVPFFAFFPGWLSVICAASTAFLMVGIQSTGSFGYFSIATIVACLTLMDNTTPRQLELSAMFDEGAPIFTNLFVVVHTLSASVAFLFNSWASQSWHLWAFWYQLPKVFQIPVHFFRYLHPFRWLHPFGVFPPNNWPAAKMSLLFECTWDREKWHEMEFEYSPSNERSRPRFVAPHHPRADQAVIYDTMGLNPTSLITGHLSGWDPYAFGSRAPSVGACQYLLHGGKTNLLKCEELRRRSEPPVAMRVSTIMLEPVSLAERSTKGTWWKRTYIGPHVPTQEKDPLFFDYAIADPELWHFDSIFWRRRSRLRPLMDRALAGEDPEKLAPVDGDGIITAADVETFWNEFVPLLGGDVRRTFDTLPDTVEAVKTRFDARTQRALYRLLQRFSLFLVVRLEPHYLYKWLTPGIPVKTYFHLWMLAQYIIGNGRQAYLAAYREPLSVVKYVPELTTQNGLYAQSVFRFDEMTFEAQKLRLITAYVFPHDAKEKAILAEKTRGCDLSGLKPGERLFINIARTVSGFFNVLPDIRDGFKGPRFERGSPERYPVFHELPDGEVVVKEYG